MEYSTFDSVASARKAWNAGRTVGAKFVLKPPQVWAIRFWLGHEGRLRDRAFLVAGIAARTRGQILWCVTR